ncbi:MAG: hypothetical protein Tsb0013_23080 [Phycisphaerales bacterium]
MTPETPIDAHYTIERVSGNMLLPAASRLAEAASGVQDAGGELLEAARMHAISFRYFWASTTSGEERTVRQACLVVPGAGRTGMCFTTRPTTEAQEHELAAVIDHACTHLPGNVVRLAQALLEPQEGSLIRAYERGGMPTLATLLYLRRSMPTRSEFTDVAPLPEGVELTPYRAGRDDGVLLDVLPRTYEGTLDCPELSHMRRPEDVVASHRAAGAWTPALWWVIREGGRAEGVALFNPMPEQDATELVYFGLTPRMRGRGLGRVLLEHALARLRGRQETWLTCACDERNAPALRVYGSLGMRERERRIALVRVIDA